MNMHPTFNRISLKVLNEISSQEKYQGEKERVVTDIYRRVVHQAKTRVNWKGNVVPVRSMCHFSWYCDGMSDEPIEDDAWDDAQIIAEMVQRDGFRGISEGATHYHATYVSPNWTSDRGMVPVGRIGLHKFYRWH